MAPGLCENCHKKPKFGPHKFCGKTCAAQAASKSTRPKTKQVKVGRHGTVPVPQKAVQLCDYCGRKPKFQNFDYCGKSCAAQANAQTTRQVPSAPATQKTGRAPGAASNNPSHVGGNATRAIQATTPSRGEDSTDAEGDEADEDDEDDCTDLDNYPSDSEEEESLSPALPVAQPPKLSAKGRKTTAPRLPPGTCAIPHCGRPSHIDKNGTKTNYCSNKHREEAVVIGLEKPCIMCQRYPQSDSDYFCSSVCRQQSMTKT